MTRINANIRPKDLIDQHLIAEYRELIRIPNTVIKDFDKARLAISKNRIYTFRLGKGHVIFVYNKLKFLHYRFIDIKNELDNRKITNNIKDEMFINIPVDLYQNIDHSQLREANFIVINRLEESIFKMKRKPTINGQEIDLNNYFIMLRNYYILT